MVQNLLKKKKIDNGTYNEDLPLKKQNTNLLSFSLFHFILHQLQSTTFFFFL